MTAHVCLCSDNDAIGNRDCAFHGGEWPAPETEPLAPCGHECACPTRLHHDVSALLAEYEAPVARRSTYYYMSRLADMLADAMERDAS